LSQATSAPAPSEIFGIVNWLLRRDVDPLTPANDNTPMGLNAVA
jgi:hypothetical protein